MPCYCIVSNCHTKSRRKGVSYCRIPAVITNQGEETQQLSEKRRRLWLAAINRVELTENTLHHARVCGAHFVSGKAAPLWNRTSVDWVPTLNLRLRKISEDEERAQEERAQERAWRRFKIAKRRRREAAIAGLSAEEKHSSEMQPYLDLNRPVPSATPGSQQQGGLQTGGDISAPSTSKRARIADSSQVGGEELQHGAGDHDIEGDRNPPVVGGILGFSKETTFALLPRMHLEELLSELNRRNIEVKLAGGDRPRGRGDLEHVLREVMTREYEEAEGDDGMDMSNTSSTFEHGRSNTSSTFEHGSWLEEVDSNEVLSGLNKDQATSQNVQEPTVKEETSNTQAANKDVSETPSTDTFPGQVQVKKEPTEQDCEYHAAMSSNSSHTVARSTEPLTSQTQHPGTATGPGPSQPNLASAQNLAVEIKTEPSSSAGETTEGEEPDSEDLSSEACPSSPGQLSHELDMLEVSLGDKEEDKLSSEEPVKETAGMQEIHVAGTKGTFTAASSVLSTPQASSKYVRGYLKRTKEPVYICPTCGAQIFTENGAKQHALRHTESAYKFHCNKCSKKFLLQSEYTRHPCMKQGKVFKCWHCLAEFNSKRGLQLHESSHTRKAVSCKECGQRFDSSYKLRYHYQKEHESPIKKACRFCRKEFSTTAARKTHEAICKDNVRTNPVLHKCHQCSKVFKSKWNLVRHKSTHTDHRECTVCKKSFKNDQQLGEHMLIHTGVQCTICEKHYKDENSLNKHVKYRHPEENGQGI